MLNKVILMGRLTRDPDYRQTQNGTAVARFSVAVDRRFTNQQTGQREADFINVTAWRQQADFVNRYFRKGSMIIVEGSLRNDNYTDQQGVKHYSMIVQADNVSFGETRRAAEEGGHFSAPTGGGYGNQNGYGNQGGYGGGYSNDNSGYGQSAYAQPAAPAPSYSAPAPQVPPATSSIGNLDEFEEVLSDGDVPF